MNEPPILPFDLNQFIQSMPITSEAALPPASPPRPAPVNNSDLVQVIAARLQAFERELTVQREALRRLTNTQKHDMNDLLGAIYDELFTPRNQDVDVQAIFATVQKMIEQSSARQTQAFETLLVAFLRQAEQGTSQGGPEQDFPEEPHYVRTQPDTNEAAPTTDTPLAQAATEDEPAPPFTGRIDVPETSSLEPVSSERARVKKTAVPPPAPAAQG